MILASCHNNTESLPVSPTHCSCIKETGSKQWNHILLRIKMHVTSCDWRPFHCQQTTERGEKRVASSGCHSSALGPISWTYWPRIQSKSLLSNYCTHVAHSSQPHWRWIKKMLEWQGACAGWMPCVIQFQKHTMGLHDWKRCCNCTTTTTITHTRINAEHTHTATERHGHGTSLRVCSDAFTYCLDLNL